MIGLADVRDWLSGLGVIGATWSIGRYEANREQRACVFQRRNYESATVALGRDTDTLVKHVNVIVHWNKNHRETEETALALYNALEGNPSAVIGGRDVYYIDLLMPEPLDLGSDENGIFERAIWFDIYFKNGE